MTRIDYKGYQYEIDDADAFTVRAYDPSNPLQTDTPFLLQPYNPLTGDPFGSHQEAEEWIIGVIDALTNPPPDSE